MVAAKFMVGGSLGRDCSGVNRNRTQGSPGSPETELLQVLLHCYVRDTKFSTDTHHRDTLCQSGQENIRGRPVDLGAGPLSTGTGAGSTPGAVFVCGCPTLTVVDLLVPFPTKRGCLTVTVRTNETKVVESVVRPIPIDMVQLKGQRLALPHGSVPTNSTFLLNEVISKEAVLQVSALPGGTLNEQGFGGRGQSGGELPNRMGPTYPVGGVQPHLLDPRVDRPVVVPLLCAEPQLPKNVRASDVLCHQSTELCVAARENLASN